MCVLPCIYRNVLEMMPKPMRIFEIIIIIIFEIMGAGEEQVLEQSQIT